MVDAEHQLESLARAPACDETCVVHESVERTSDRGSTRAYRVEVGEVERNELDPCSAILLNDCRAGSDSLVAITTREQDASAPPSELAGGDETDPAVRAGDEKRPVLEIADHELLRNGHASCSAMPSGIASCTPRSRGS